MDFVSYIVAHMKNQLSIPFTVIYSSETVAVCLPCVWKDRLYLTKYIMLMMLKEGLFGKKLSSCFLGISTLCYFQQRYVPLLIHFVCHWCEIGEILQNFLLV